jgi:hypothetical protein
VGTPVISGQITIGEVGIALFSSGFAAAQLRDVEKIHGSLVILLLGHPDRRIGACDARSLKQ